MACIHGLTLGLHGSNELGSRGHSRGLGSPCGERIDVEGLGGAKG
jgi:hypothetical protein